MAYCQYCLEKVSPLAKVCPHCGEPDPYDPDYSYSSSSSSARQPTLYEKNQPLFWMLLTLGGVIAAGIGWLMVTSAAAFSLVWWLGVILLIGGVICLIPAVFMIGYIAFWIAVGLLALAVFVAIVNYFVQHPY